MARILFLDNLKTCVIKHTKHEIVLNKSYQGMAEHYGTAILPARVCAPKDKPTVEGTVGNVSTYILAAIRNQRFFTLRELKPCYLVFGGEGFTFPLPNIPTLPVFNDAVATGVQGQRHIHWFYQL